MTWTLADGACALHSVFGSPEVGSGRIECPQVRDLLVKALPQTINELVTSSAGHLQEAARSIMQTLWAESILVIASKKVEISSMDSPRESLAHWEGLPLQYQADVVQFVERRQTLEQDLDKFYSQFFAFEHESQCDASVF